MKNILVTILLGLSSIAHAQPFYLEKSVVCAETATMMETLRGSNFKENFVQFTVGYSLSDVWFNKRKYD